MRRARGLPHSVGSAPGNVVKPFYVTFPRSHSSDCRKMAEYMVRHSRVNLSVITFSTQNILELYFGRSKVIFWLIIGVLLIVTVACHFNVLNIFFRDESLS